MVITSLALQENMITSQYVHSSSAQTEKSLLLHEFSRSNMYFVVSVFILSFLVVIKCLMNGDYFPCPATVLAVASFSYWFSDTIYFNYEGGSHIYCELVHMGAHKVCSKTTFL